MPKIPLYLGDFNTRLLCFAPSLPGSSSVSSSASSTPLNLRLAGFMPGSAGMESSSDINSGQELASSAASSAGFCSLLAAAPGAPVVRMHDVDQDSAITTSTSADWFCTQCF